MSFSLSAPGYGTSPQLPDLQELLLCDAPKTYELVSGDAAPLALEGPLTPVEAWPLLTAAKVELDMVENHVMLHRSPLYQFLQTRFERYQKLKLWITAQLFKQPFDHGSVQRGLFQFRQSTWALRQLLASGDEAQLLDLSRETFNWIRVARHLARELPPEQQVRDYGETFDALLCRLERASTRHDYLDILGEVRCRFGGLAQTHQEDPRRAHPRQGMHASPPSTSPRPTLVPHAGHESLQHSPRRKRPLPDTSSSLGNVDPAGCTAASPSKRAMAERFGAGAANGISPLAGTSRSWR